MTKITAHDVAALTRLNAEVQRWNEAHPDAPLTAAMFIDTQYRVMISELQMDYADELADNLGDAISAALDAWKKARG